MPAHDWTKVPPGIFHHFHNGWIVALADALNGGALPRGYYALSEQVAGGIVPDVITLECAPGPGPERGRGEPRGRAATSVEADPPRATVVARARNVSYAELRKTIAIRHVSGHEVVALIEILSPANKGSRMELETFLHKAQASLEQRVHLALVDLFPPGRLDPNGIHGALWEALGQDPYRPTQGKPLLAASYEAADEVTAYLEPFAAGDPLPSLPLFLDAGLHVPLPLDSSYASSFSRVPSVWRGAVEARAAP